MNKSEFRVLVVGGIGHGKSSFINSIVEKYACEVGGTWGVDKTITKDIQEIDLERKEDIITFFDTPSLKVLSSNKKFQDLQKTGFHAIVIVISIKSYALQSPVLHEAKKLFGNILHRYALLVFTFADYLEGSNVDEYLKAYPELQEFSKDTEKRCILFDSSLENDSEGANNQRRTFFDYIETVFGQNEDELKTRKRCCIDMSSLNIF